MNILKDLIEELQGEVKGLPDNHVVKLLEMALDIQCQLDDLKWFQATTPEQMHKLRVRVLQIAAQVRRPDWQVIDLDSECKRVFVQHPGYKGFFQVELLCKGENPFLQVRKGVA